MTIGGVKSKVTRSYQKGKCNSPIFSSLVFMNTANFVQPVSGYTAGCTALTKMLVQNRNFQ